ncbi:MAG: hypothetical protein RBT60_08370 [Candidatus Krumholzibacteria bacterium]|nr:hypothetical protein [Candidatus Krumholzibacteria bacterium]
MIATRTLLLSIIVGVAASAAANPLPVFGWEDCGATVLGLDGPGIEPILAARVTAPDPVYDGNYSLRLAHNAPGATPRATIAYVYGLSPDAQVHIEIVRFDAEPAGGSCRIRGRYLADDSDAGGPEDPVGTGWQWIVHTWQMTADYSELAIDVEMIGDAGDTVWLDGMIVFPVGSNGELVTPCWDHWFVPVEGSTLSAVKDLFR